MLVVVSPAKNLDYTTPVATKLFSQPALLDDTQSLLKVCQTLTPADLSGLMGISDKLALLNAERFATFKMPFTSENARQAALAFNGDVYRGLDAYTIEESKIEALQQSVRIISGLYGLLKPLDLVQPYRMEMGTKLPVGKSKNLYEFWRQKVTNALNDELEDGELFVNLASQEYFKAIDTKVLKVPVIHVDFKEFKNGQYKTIAIFAKLARGYMTRFIIENAVETVDELKTFTTDGYAYDSNLSNDTKLVFTR